MAEQLYADVITGKVVTHHQLQRARAVYKAAAFTAEELAPLGFALIAGDTAGDVPTQSATLDNGQWLRVMRQRTAEEQAILDEQAAREAKLAGVLFEGVMCSATARDQFGLASIRHLIVEQGASVPFHFDNGTVLVLHPGNREAFEAAWVPFRQGFFA